MRKKNPSNLGGMLPSGGMNLHHGRFFHNTIMAINTFASASAARQVLVHRSVRSCKCVRFRLFGFAMSGILS